MEVGGGIFEVLTTTAVVYKYMFIMLLKTIGILLKTKVFCYSNLL